MSMMFFADEDEVPLPPREVRIITAEAQPSPDGRRIALDLTLTPFLEYPNLEIALFRPDGTEERSMSIIGTMDRRLNLTLHVRQPAAGSYRIQIDLVHDNEVLQTRTLTLAVLAV